LTKNKVVIKNNTKPRLSTLWKCFINIRNQLLLFFHFFLEQNMLWQQNNFSNQFSNNFFQFFYKRNIFWQWLNSIINFFLHFFPVFSWNGTCFRSSWRSWTRSAEVTFASSSSKRSTFSSRTSGMKRPSVSLLIISLA